MNFQSSKITFFFLFLKQKEKNIKKENRKNGVQAVDFGSFVVTDYKCNKMKNSF